MAFDYVTAGPPTIPAPTTPSLAFDKDNDVVYVSTKPSLQRAPAWVAVGGSGGLSVNGTLVGSPDLDNSFPAPPAGKVNVIWQTNGSQISGYVDVAGASAAGSNGQIQFNDNSAFGGTQALSWDKTTNQLTAGMGTPPDETDFQIGSFQDFTVGTANSVFGSFVSKINLNLLNDTSNDFYGFLNQISFDGSKALNGNLYGSWTDLTINTSTPTINTVITGQYCTITQGGAAGLIGQLVGGGFVVIANTGGVATLQGTQIQSTLLAGSVTLQSDVYTILDVVNGNAVNSSGLFIEPPVFKTGTGIVSHRYGVYIDNQAGLFDGPPDPSRNLDYWGIFEASATEKNALGSINIGGSTGPLLSANTGSPEGSVVAPVGSVFLRKDGTPGTTLYVKEANTDDTGWTAISSIILSTNGTPNGDQTQLNLQAGTGILLTDNGSGTVAIQTDGTLGIAPGSTQSADSTGSIGASTLTTGLAPFSPLIVEFYIGVISAGAGGSTISVTLTWNDGAAKSKVIVASLAADSTASSASVSVPLMLATGQNLQYSITSAGAAHYAYFANVYHTN